MRIDLPRQRPSVCPATLRRYVAEKMGDVALVVGFFGTAGVVSFVAFLYLGPPIGGFVRENLFPTLKPSGDTAVGALTVLISIYVGVILIESGRTLAAWKERKMK